MPSGKRSDVFHLKDADKQGIIERYWPGQAPKVMIFEAEPGGPEEASSLTIRSLITAVQPCFGGNRPAEDQMRFVSVGTESSLRLDGATSVIYRLIESSGRVWRLAYVEFTTPNQEILAAHLKDNGAKSRKSMSPEERRLVNRMNPDSMDFRPRSEDD